MCINNCLTELQNVKKNKNMRQVIIMSHGQRNTSRTKNNTLNRICTLMSGKLCIISRAQRCNYDKIKFFDRDSRRCTR